MMGNRHVVEDFVPSWRQDWVQAGNQKVRGRIVEPEEVWDRFIEHYARKHGFVDNNGEISVKNFIGGIEGYKKQFLEAQKGQ